MYRYLLLTLGFFPGIKAAQPQEIKHGIVHTADVDLSYEIYGLPSPASPLIVIHGGPGIPHDYFLLTNAWSTLAQRRQIVFYDQRGVGASKLLRADASQDMDAQASDLDALRAGLGFSKFTPVGHSWGGVVAMGYASRHPEHVKNIILVDSGSPSISDTPVLFSKVFPDLSDKDNKQMNVGEAEFGPLFRYLSMLFYDPEHRDTFIASMKGAHLSTEVNEAAGAATKRLDLTGVLSKFSFPALVIHGRFDMNVALLSSWKIYKTIPHAQFSVFEKSGHMPFYEEPSKFVQVLNQFLFEHEQEDQTER